MMSGFAESRQASDGRDGKAQLVRLLSEALELADSLALPHEIGARLQETIDLVGSCGNREVPSPC